MRDKIETIPFKEPDMALFDSLRQLAEAAESRERVQEWIDWQPDQLYGLGEHEHGPQSIERMLNTP